MFKFAKRQAPSRKPSSSGQRILAAASAATVTAQA